MLASMRVLHCFLLCSALAWASQPTPAPPPRLLPLVVHDGRLSTVENDTVFTPIQLKGATVTSLLYSCVQNRGIYDGPIDDLYLDAIDAWNIGIVRVPLNEDCLLGINGVNPFYSGVPYRSALLTWVDRLVARGKYVILDLHWSGAGSSYAIGQQPMPDWDHAPTFWTLLTHMFGSRREVIFDLFNEPYPGDNTVNSTAAWRCWKYGLGECLDIKGWSAIGFDDLVRIVRAEGSENVLMLGGINYANSLDEWVDYAPEGDSNIAASWHSYSGQVCDNEACWNATVRDAVLRRGHAVVVGELGEMDCRGEYISNLTSWLNAQGDGSGEAPSYLAWIFLPFPCASGPGLVTDLNGTCTDSYGCTYQSILRLEQSGHPTTTTQVLHGLRQPSRN